MTEYLLHRIDGPQDLHGLTDERAPAGRPGGPRAHHRHSRRDRGSFRRQSRAPARSRWRCTRVLDSPRDKILWDVGHQAYPHKILTGRRDQLRDDPQVRRPGAVLLDPRVRARHHGRRPCVDRDRLRGRDQGGDAPRPRRGRARRRGRRRRRTDRRRRLRGGASGRRRGHADRRRAQRQRDVDRAQRRARCRATSTASGSTPSCGTPARSVEGGLTKLPAGIGAAFERLGPALQGVDQGVLGARPVVGGARLRLYGRHRRPRRARAAARAARGARPPSGRSWSTAPPSRARASPPPRRAAWRGWRSGTPPSPSRSPTAPPRGPARAP